MHDGQEDRIDVQQKALSKILEQEIISFEQLSPTYSMATPISWYNSQNASWKSKQASSRKHSEPKQFRSEIHQLLKRSFGHLAANPSIVANKMALKRAYRFPQSVNSDVFNNLGMRPPPLIVNETEQTAKHFIIDTVSESAKLQASNFLEKRTAKHGVDTSTEAIFQDNKWIMIGDRGIGKTIFLNYLISQYMDELHKNKSILVRLDLTKSSPRNLNIEDWLQWKLCKILFTYYNNARLVRDAEFDADDDTWKHLVIKENNGLLFDFTSNNDTLFQIAKSYDIELSRIEFKKAIREEAVYLGGDHSQTPRKLSYAWLFPAIWDYAVKVKKCNFIFVFDGMDQLGLTKGDRERFQRVLDNVSTYIGTEHSEFAAFLITMRPNTFRETIGDDNFRSGFNYCVVTQSPTLEIVDQRRKYLEHRKTFEQRFKIVQKLGRRYKKNIAEFVDYYLKFASWSLSHSVNQGKGDPLKISNDLNVAFEILEGIFGTNRRKLLQSLADVSLFFVQRLPGRFDEIIESAKAEKDYRQELADTRDKNSVSSYGSLGRWSYLFIEALMLENIYEQFRSEKYQFLLKNDGEIVQTTGVGDNLNHYLVNVFHHPNFPGTPNKSLALMGIRILQFGIAGNVFQSSSLFSYLEHYFGYEHIFVEIKFYEMVESGLINHHSDADNQVLEGFEVSQAGVFSLNRLIGSLEYVSLALQTVPLPKTLVSNGAFPVRIHSAPEFVIFNKIVATTNFLRFLAQLETNEIRHYEEIVSKSSETDPTPLEFEEHHLIVGKMMTQIKYSMDRIIANAHENELSNQLSNLDRVFSNWPS